MQYDQNRDGYISHDEAHHILEQELSFVPQQTQQLVKHYDSNGDGKLSFEEFVGFYFKVQEK